jgi:hypothetical protein
MIKRKVANNAVVLAFLFSIVAFQGFSQKEIATIGENLMRIEKNQTILQAQEMALQQAKIDGIERVFGRVIINGNSTYLQNKLLNKSVETKSSFAFFSDSFVKGEWVRNTSEPIFTFQTLNGEQWLNVKVSGLVREIESGPITFKLNTLNCEKGNCVTEIFRNDQDFYIQFKSPENGFLAIYLDDPSMGETSRILPYQNTRLYQGAVPIQRNKEYLFFSKKLDQLNEIGAVDELNFKLSRGVDSEQYKLFILFSPEPFSAPLVEDKSHLFLDRSMLSRGITLPRSMESPKFQEWLQKVRINKRKLQVDYRYMSLVK